ncbi:phosphoglucosamine mutase, partial [Streptosporangium algeriense]
LTSLHLLSVVARTGKPLAELASVMTRLPQILVNVKDVDRAKASVPELSAAVAAVELELGETGRVLIRPSGTEPMIRVMVEASSAEQAERMAGHLADVVRTACV